MDPKLGHRVESGERGSSSTDSACLGDLAEEDLRTGNCSANQLERMGRYWSSEPNGYQWPSSKLSPLEMAKLKLLSRQLKRPINQLIKEAVNSFADQKLTSMEIDLSLLGDSS